VQATLLCKANHSGAITVLHAGIITYEEAPAFLLHYMALEHHSVHLPSSLADLRYVNKYINKIDAML
jgi:hypothetical protein